DLVGLLDPKTKQELFSSEGPLDSIDMLSPLIHKGEKQAYCAVLFAKAVRTVFNQEVTVVETTKEKKIEEKLVEVSPQKAEDKTLPRMSLPPMPSFLKKGKPARVSVVVFILL